MEALRIFQLGLELPSLHLADWTRASFTSSSFDSWWQEWHAHLFCEAAHNKCVMLDEDFSSDSEVNSFPYHIIAIFFSQLYFRNTCRILNQIHQALFSTILHVQMLGWGPRHPL